MNCMDESAMEEKFPPRVRCTSTGAYPVGKENERYFSFLSDDPDYFIEYLSIDEHQSAMDALRAEHEKVDALRANGLNYLERIIGRQKDEITRLRALLVDAETALESCKVALTNHEWVRLQVENNFMGGEVYFSESEHSEILVALKKIEAFQKLRAEREQKGEK